MITEDDKEEILNAIISRNSILTAFDIHQALPQYGES